MSFGLERLHHALQRLPVAARFIVAYSGGVDSHVLLHALVRLRDRWAGVELCAVHVDHGLSPHSVAWSRHCEATCAALNVACTVRRVDARPAEDESPEEAARRARYAAFAALARRGDILMTAHHQDDQAETVLLQLLRGAGPRGLAAMPELTLLGEAHLARPLLEFSRDALHEYARQYALAWIDDHSNADVRFDRNYLRQAVVPLLKQRWPSAGVTIARVARHCAAAAELQDQLARIDLRFVSEAAGAECLSIPRLLTLTPSRQRNLVRHWLERLHLPLPQTKHLDQLLDEVAPAAEDARPCVRWPGAEVRRYRDRLYAMAPLPPYDAHAEFRWDLQQPLSITGVGVLRATSREGAGLRVSAIPSAVTVRLRRGGERIRPSGRCETHTLKHLLQDAGVPPWRRERLPLIWIGEHLAAVPGYWTAADYAATAGEAGIVFEFAPEPPTATF